MYGMSGYRGEWNNRGDWGRRGRGHHGPHGFFIVPVILLAGFLPIDALLHLTNIGTLFAFVIVCAAVLIMRRTHPEAARPFRCPMVPLVPILGILMCLLLMFSLPAANWLRLLAWLLLGFAIYFFYGRHHSVIRKQMESGEV